jgi:hypothetical protein
VVADTGQGLFAAEANSLAAMANLASAQFSFHSCVLRNSSDQENIGGRIMDRRVFLKFAFGIAAAGAATIATARAAPLAPLTGKPIEPNQLPQNAVANDDDLNEAQIEQVRWGRRRGWGHRHWGWRRRRRFYRRRYWRRRW